MDLFNTKKLAALEARIAALEPKTTDVSSTWVSYTYPGGDDTVTVKKLAERVKKIEDEVMPESVGYRNIFSILYDDKPEKLTLRRKVERLCEHLKVRFVTEPQRTVIKPVREKKATSRG